MRRSTPWVLGCCGPMLMIIVSSSPATMSGAEARRSASVSLRRSMAPTSRSSSFAFSSLRERSSWPPS